MVKKRLSTSIILSVFFTLFISFFLIGNNSFGSVRSGIIASIALIFYSAIFFMIFYSGMINKWRRVFFITFAIAFVISFVWWTMGDRGHMWLLDKEILYAEAPMCHIVVPMLILPMIFNGVIIFPVQYATGAFMILVVIVVALIFGRAFCSWGCFFGGQDELFASIPKKRRWKIRELHPFVKYFSFAMLAFIILHSFATLTPTYCFWFCPFKISSEFIEVNSFVRVLATFLFVALWTVLVMLLPYLSKKRTQCSLFCPMGAFLSCTNKINLFNITVDKEKCTNCNLCMLVCPNFAISKESIAKGKALMTCTKCGACIEKCPAQAVSYSVLGAIPRKEIKPLNIKKGILSEIWDTAVLFIFGIFSVGTIMATGNITDAISRLLKFFLGV